MSHHPHAPGLLGVDRPLEGRLIGGVCVGWAERFNVDATLLRLAALILLLASGLGFFVYLLLWALTPLRGQEPPSLWATVKANIVGLGSELHHVGEYASRIWNRTDRTMTWPRPLSRRWIAIASIALGVLILLLSLGLFGWLTLTRAVALILIVIGASVLIARAPDLRR